MNDTMQAAPRRLRVWDAPTRLLHWSLVALLLTAWASGDEEALFTLHQLAGYGVLAALLFRLVWGFVGGEHARWRDFVRGPSAVATHLRAVIERRPPRCIGHNPLGGWMVLALLLGLGALVASGLLAADDGLAGPLAGNLGSLFADLHEGLASALVVLAGLHVAGVLLESSLTGDNLLAGMWRGWKAWPHGTAASDAVGVPWWRAAVTLAFATGIVCWLVTIG